jgi:hypothetical protein
LTISLVILEAGKPDDAERGFAVLMSSGMGLPFMMWGGGDGSSDLNHGAAGAGAAEQGELEDVQPGEIDDGGSGEGIFGDPWDIMSVAGAGVAALRAGQPLSQLSDLEIYGEPRLSGFMPITMQEEKETAVSDTPLTATEIVRDLLSSHPYLTSQQLWQMATDGWRPVLPAAQGYNKDGSIRMKKASNVREGRRIWVPPPSVPLPDHPFRSTS